MGLRRTARRRRHRRQHRRRWRRRRPARQTSTVARRLQRANLTRRRRRGTDEQLQDRFAVRRRRRPAAAGTPAATAFAEGLTARRGVPYASARPRPRTATMRGPAVGDAAGSAPHDGEAGAPLEVADGGGGDVRRRRRTRDAARTRAASRRARGRAQRTTVVDDVDGTAADITTIVGNPACQMCARRMACHTRSNQRLGTKESCRFFFRGVASPRRRSAALAGPAVRKSASLLRPPVGRRRRHPRARSSARGYRRRRRRAIRRRSSSAAAAAADFAAVFFPAAPATPQRAVGAPRSTASEISLQTKDSHVVREAPHALRALQRGRVVRGDRAGRRRRRRVDGAADAHPPGVARAPQVRTESGFSSRLPLPAPELPNAGDDGRDGTSSFISRARARARRRARGRQITRPMVRRWFKASGGEGRAAAAAAPASRAPNPARPPSSGA